MPVRGSVLACTATRVGVRTEIVVALLLSVDEGVVSDARRRARVLLPRLSPLALLSVHVRQLLRAFAAY
jgi:hypothetical protein